MPARNLTLLLKRRTVCALASMSVMVAGLGAVGCSAAPIIDHGGSTASVVRTYFIAADEVPWDYAPLGFNNITGEPFDDVANVFVANGPDRIGKVYIKARYREYTDATFSTLKPIPPEWEHLGVHGPVIRGVVGDTIIVHFKNQTTRPVSMHPHGVFYRKNSEGAPYNDDTGPAAKLDDAVAPGVVYDYRWDVPERAGPGPADGSSVFWMYHSHTDEVADTFAGLMGPLIITGRGQARADGSPIDIDREFVSMFMVLDENQSPYLQQNIDTYAGDPASVNPDDEEFAESNLMHSINGYVYGNLPGLVMNRGERIRWYMMGFGNEVDLHTPHWHGNTLVEDGHRRDVVELLPGSLLTADMTPDDPGTWLYHCHVSDHILAGMLALYHVNP